MTLLQGANGNTSSKRVAGIIGFMSCILITFVCVYASLFLGVEIDYHTMSLVIALLGVSGSVLGMGVFEKKIEEKKIEEKKEVQNEYEL